MFEENVDLTGEDRTTPVRIKQHQPPRVLGIIKFETGHRRYVDALLPELVPRILYSDLEYRAMD